MRLDSGRFGTPSFRDAIYGPFQKKDPEEDFVLMKSDGYPVYHLANVIDDHLMNITHVIRGEVSLLRGSTPKAIAYNYPGMAHLYTQAPGPLQGFRLGTPYFCSSGSSCER